MKELPHTYEVKVNATAQSNLQVRAEGLPAMEVAPPAQFGGPGDQWSPEDLLMSSVASCFILSFRAIAKASRFEWLSIDCDSRGELDKVDRQVRFTKISTKARLLIPSSEDPEKAEKLLHKAEQTCLISNSLSSELYLECEITVDG